MTPRRIRIVGQSGSGLQTIGKFLTQALTRQGLWVCADREYPSLIKGGASCYTINADTDPIYSLDEKTDLLIALDRPGLTTYAGTLEQGGYILHGYERMKTLQKFFEALEPFDITVQAISARSLALEHGGNVRMSNMVMIGAIAHFVGLEEALIRDIVQKKYSTRPHILDPALASVHAGYEAAESHLSLPAGGQAGERTLIDGNEAIALGAIAAGVRLYSAYPMSPASSILTHLARLAPKTGMLIKQAEDEITAAQMALGANFAGTRAFTATSGGGYDLMTETVSLAGMIEQGNVIVIAQRPGPATGLPTWTGQGDLQLAIHAGHGEFPRIVRAVSDPVDAFVGIQQAFDLADRYQTQVLLLTEKQVAEEIHSVPVASLEHLPVRQYLVTEPVAERYTDTPDGVSERWIPGANTTFYCANGDEHNEQGHLTEQAEDVQQMYAKRMRKLETIRKNLPDPEILGDIEKADMVLIGWGSTRNVMRDVLKAVQDRPYNIAYVHYAFVWPLETEALNTIFTQKKNVCVLEGNYDGQLAQCIRQETGYAPTHVFRKYNGRPFFRDEVLSYLDNQLQS